MNHSNGRREFLQSFGLGLFGIAAGGDLFAGRGFPGVYDERTLYVGTYTSGKSKGIYRCRFDLTSGSLKVESAVMEATNPSFLAIDKSRHRLFAVNETSEFDGKPGGSVSSFSIDPATGDLQLLSRRSSQGGDPCHLTVDSAGRHVLVANYSGGSVAVLPVQDDGTLGEATDVVQHRGSSVHRRQQAPHAHSVNLDDSNRFAYVADLGLDKVMIYRFDGTGGKLVPAEQRWGELKAGAGPRHMVLHPDGQMAYVVNELDSTLTRFAVDRSTGALEQRQTISTLSRDFAGDNYPADVHIAPSGRFVYISNRGLDTIVVFAIDEKTGELSSLQHQPTRGKWPRNFSIDPTGRYLLVANQRSDTIAVFSIDEERGTLSPESELSGVPVPVCVKFL